MILKQHMGNVKLALTLLCFLLFSAKLHAAEPVVQTSNLKVTVVTCSSVTITFTPGDGIGRIMLCKQGSAVDSDPSDNTSYAPNSKFKGPGGAVIATGNYVVYNGSNSNYAQIDSLQPNTTYYFAVYEHDNTGNNTQYLTDNPARISVTTLGINLDFHINVVDSCQDHNLFEFKNNTVTTVSGLNYTWNFGDGNTAAGYDASHTYTGSGKILVTLRSSVNPAWGCPDKFSRYVSVYQKKNAIITLNDSTQCLWGNRFTSSSKPIISPGVSLSFTYDWDFGDGDHSTFSKFTNKIYKKADNYNIRLIVTIRNIANGVTGCYDTLDIPIVVLPSPSNSAVVDDTMKCLNGNTFNFNNPDLTLTSYKWYFGDGDSSLQKQASHTYAATGTYQVIHMATSNQGCYGADTMKVEVGTNQDATFTGLDTFYCNTAAPVTMVPNSTSTTGVFKGIGVMGDKFTPPKYNGVYAISHIMSSDYCDDTATINVRIQEAPVVDLGRDTAICNISNYTIDAGIPGSYLWTNGATTQTTQVFATGHYGVTVTEGKCSDADTVKIVFATYPIVNLGNDTVICKGSAVFLNATNEKAAYVWNSGSNDTAIYAYTTGLYKVSVKNPCGTTVDSIFVTLQDEYCDLFMANAFSPNSDPFNKVFFVRGRDIKVTKFTIYNRWGQIVFQTNDGNTGWDGTFMGEDCPDGAYIWRLEYNTKIGPRTKSNNASGQVNLFR